VRTWSLVGGDFPISFPLFRVDRCRLPPLPCRGREAGASSSSAQHQHARHVMLHPTSPPVVIGSRAFRNGPPSGPATPMRRLARRGKCTVACVRVTRDSTAVGHFSVARAAGVDWWGEGGLQWKHTVKRTLGKWFYGKDLVMKKLASRAWRDYRVAKQLSRALNRRAAQHSRRRLTAAAMGEWRCVCDARALAESSLGGGFSLHRESSRVSSAKNRHE
jgi:hypothetical protein